MRSHTPLLLVWLTVLAAVLSALLLVTPSN
jgi:hypothetical protein